MLKARNLRKTYPPDFLAVEDFDIDLQQGEFAALLGPNGCGKTTFLKIAAGIEDYQSGILEFNGQPINGTDPRRPVIFQDIRMYPWMTISDNIIFGLECIGVKREEARSRSQGWLKRMSLNQYAGIYPQEAPAGLTQVANVARILALDPELILCDEPFNFLDWKYRSYLQTEFLKYYEETNKTILFVTHNIEEAVYMAQKVYVMTSRPGKIKEVVDIDLPKKRWEVHTDDTRFLKAVKIAMDLVGDEVKKARQSEGLS